MTWRGKTYVGTLLDCTKHDWASPRFCDSPSSSDLESKSLSRFHSGKRFRGSISENENNIKLPQSKLRNGKGRRNPNSCTAREEQPQDLPHLANNPSNLKRLNNGRSDSSVKHSPSSPDKNSSSTSATNNLPNQTKNQQSSPVLIRCPEPTCNKRYRHINGLKYHQAHHPHNEINNNSSKSLASSANKTGEQSESNKESEETTDTEDYSDNKEAALNKLHSRSNKLVGKCGKSNKEERNKSPFSDISDDIENDSRPSCINDVHANQPTNLSTKREEASVVNETSYPSSSLLNNADKLSKMNDAYGNLKPVIINNDDQKTNEELRKLANEVDQKISKNAVHQSTFADKPPLNALVNTIPSNALPNNSSSVKSNCNSLFSPNFTIEPALQAFLMQTDLNYRLNYDRFLMENQEKLLNQLTSIEVNSLSDLEKERYKSCFQTSSSTIFNGFNNFTNSSKDPVFKLPGNNHLPIPNANSVPRNLNSPRPTHSERPPSTSSVTSASGGSIVNGTSSQSQNKNASSPYDFMEYEKQMEKQREEMFRLSNSFKMEEQRLLNTKVHFSNSNIKLQGSHQNENPLSGSNNKMVRSDEEASSHQTKNLHNFLSFTAPGPQTIPSTTNQGYTIPTTALTSFSSSKTSLHHLPFDPAFLNQNVHFSPSLLNGIQQPAFLNPLDSLRFASAGLSTIDLNSANNSSKLMTDAGQQETQMLSNSKHQTNGLHRNLAGTLNQNSPSALNASNNNCETKDENRSPSLHNPSNVGFQTVVDPYGGKLTFFVYTVNFTVLKKEMMIRVSKLIH